MKPYVVGVWDDASIDIFVVKASSTESAIESIKADFQFSSEAKFRVASLPAEIGSSPIYLIDLWD